MHDTPDIRDVYVGVVYTRHYILKVRTHFVHMSIYHEVPLTFCICVEGTELHHDKLSEDSAL